MNQKSRWDPIKDPNIVEQREDGWIFWRETWADFYGPWSTKEECVRMLELYLAHLDTEHYLEWKKSEVEPTEEWDY